MVGLRTLTPSVEVRILYPQPTIHLKNYNPTLYFPLRYKKVVHGLLQLFVLLIITACSNDNNSPTLEIRNGLSYQSNQTKPFSGKHTSYYENGTKKNESMFKEGMENGLIISWYENGQQKTEEHYQYGRRVGIRLEWYKSGRKKSEQLYKDDKRDGASIVWDETGAILKNETYKNGHLAKTTELTYGLYQ